MRNKTKSSIVRCIHGFKIRRLSKSENGCKNLCYFTIRDTGFTNNRLMAIEHVPASKFTAIHMLIIVDAEAEAEAIGHRLQNLASSKIEGECGTESFEELQEKKREALRKPSNYDPTATMKLIDTIQRLGIGYHFEEEITRQLESFSDWDDAPGEGDLLVNALRLRLLRHNGLPSTTDVFKKFINKEGKLKESVTKDTWGMLSLYEASYLATGDEYILLQAMELTRTQLTHQSMSLTDLKSCRHIAQAFALHEEAKD